jgi:hypothetical protein
LAKAAFLPRTASTARAVPRIAESSIPCAILFWMGCRRSFASLK